MSLSGAFSFIIGMCVGSFLNVCIYRLPREISIIKPFSFCPECKISLKWYDNIPILSYFLLRGKCRNCHKKITLRYPLVEFITGCLFFFLYNRFSLSLDFFKFVFFFSLLIVVSFVDIDYHAIPVYFCFLGILVGLFFAFYESVIIYKQGFIDNLPIIVAFKGLIFGLGFTYFFKLMGDIILNIYLSLRKKDSIEGERESLGLGDVDFMGMVGIFLGIKLTVTVFFIAPFIALFYSIFAIIFKKSHLIPYLPYLSLAAFISFIWGRNIITFVGLG